MGRIQRKHLLTDTQFHFLSRKKKDEEAEEEYNPAKVKMKWEIPNKHTNRNWVNFISIITNSTTFILKW